MQLWWSSQQSCFAVMLGADDTIEDHVHVHAPEASWKRPLSAQWPTESLLVAGVIDNLLTFPSLQHSGHWQPMSKFVACCTGEGWLAAAGGCSRSGSCPSAWKGRNTLQPLPTALREVHHTSALQQPQHAHAQSCSFSTSDTFPTGRTEGWAADKLCASPPQHKGRKAEDESPLPTRCQHHWVLGGPPAATRLIHTSDITLHHMRYGC